MKFHWIAAIACGLCFCGGYTLGNRQPAVATAYQLGEMNGEQRTIDALTRRLSEYTQEPIDPDDIRMFIAGFKSAAPTPK